MTYEHIDPVTFGGSGYGNTYRFKVHHNGMSVLATNERDVADFFRYAALPIPEELVGPYDAFGNLTKGE